MKLRQLIEALQHFPDALDYDVVVPNSYGNPEVRELSVGVAYPEEKLISIGFDTFVTREGLV